MNDLDLLQSRDPLELSSQDIDQIIAYHRQNRANKAAGIKPTKSQAATVDISKVVASLIQAAKPAPVVKIRRR